MFGPDDLFNVATGALFGLTLTLLILRAADPRMPKRTTVDVIDDRARNRRGARTAAGDGPFLPALGQVVQATRSGLPALQAAAQAGKAQERHDARADFARLLSGESGAGDIDLDAEVRRLVATGNVIGAIKIVRDTKGLSLTAAKEYVDRASAG